MITLQHIQKSFGSRTLFRDCSLQIGARDRLGLIGPNGSGKTTLFRILIGDEPVERGEILIAKHVKIGYLPQEVLTLSGKKILEEVLEGSAGIISLQDKMAILEEELSSLRDPTEQEKLAKEYGKLQDRYALLGGYGLESEAKRILHGLGFREPDFERTVNELSGGWLMRIALAKILLQSPDLLLLDEPTNHLDLQSLIWLEEFLVYYPGAMVIVSHDRAFLNRLVDRIAEIEGQRIDLYSGNYDRYLSEKETRRRIVEATYKTQQKKIEQTEIFIERFRAKNTKSRQVQSRVKSLEKLERIELSKEKKEIRFRFPVPQRSGHRVIEVKDLHKSYGDLQVYRGMDLSLYRGDKASLVGTNGAGKSTLLKILAGTLDFEKGEVILGKNVTRAYFAQHQFDLLTPNHTVLEELLSMATDEGQTEIRTLLGTFLFSEEDVEKKVRVLSGGEKSRLVLAKMLLKPANLLFLDEPTSHLDISSRAVLETALKQFQGTFCLITHDRHLINAVANKVIEIDQGKPRVYLGNYDEYIHMKTLFPDEKAQPARPAQTSSRKAALRSAREERRRTIQKTSGIRRQLSDLEKKLQQVEISLTEKTQRLDDLNKRLCDPSLYTNQRETYETIEEHKKVKSQVEELTAQWESLALELEALRTTFDSVRIV